MKGFELLSCCSVLFCFFAVSFSADSIAVNQTIKDGQTIVSASGRFELGFFSPSDSTSRYVGIWYPFSNTTIVWLANREMPLNDSSGVLQLTSKGILVLHNSSNTTFWLTNISTEAKSPVAQLLDSGNLVVREADDTNEDNYLWQSFDYLTDTFLPGLKFGKNLVTGHERTLVSWKSKNDPSIGDATIRLDPDGYPQIYIRVSEVIIFRSGPWNGLRFSGMPNLKPNPIYTYEFVYNDKEIYYRYDLISTSVVSMMVINDEGIFRRLTWSNSTQTWSLYLTAQMDNCDRYGICGAYGSCNINNSPACACLNGFVPRNEPAWDSGDWTGGCVRKNESICGAGEGFYKISGVKLPDTRNSWYNRTMDIRECERICLKNCSCTAYSTLNITDGSGCLLWFEELIDIREYNENGQDFFIRLSASDLESSGSTAKKTRVWIIVVSVLVVLAAFLVFCLILHFRRKRIKRKVSIVVRQERDLTDESREKDLELPIFDFLTIANATDMFSGYNKLGEGGFGPVYKGTLKDGREIAVKRLSKDSTQGLDEFKNEVIFIAKLQHRNLVKLLGCCIEQAETMLIYEYMPNKSLDAFIFDQKKRKLLDWPMRFHIINGIARGLLYLHQDSRLRIIHRDLKASNILLDNEMNPKISDFGMAKGFGGNEIQGNTKRVVGTYGYMSPEYAIDGLFSIKSDVFSFGVLVLEIISGKRNRGFFHPDHNHNLLGHAWRLFLGEKSSELMDESLKHSSILSEVLRAVQVGLLCVQQSPDDRPTMSTVVLMLTSDISLPQQPKEPGFFTERKVFEQDSSSSKVDTCSANEITITLLDAR
ncbi:G-type lectin S-receptor-like serine/threonine-protein kinase At4g27290 [Ricinus communis]|uniref:G-type lectin S-receptor-like serine/threonine-protein kinase At4g27290 n=1 Tax=Ricinus communis TaxID=3988 RepID=UPI00201A863C|nr:G-type lectin S-receptor-like serine/threonine-protein kinase At4g27290 [Ricinus communis]